ncbi:o-succinylbenzoate synthase [Photobacterium halotolerans]|uniref:o-succinylbenzoate synthase n=1 Tax=Photobacterium halotolerans TaxID=265726 RepID=A0A7X4WEJ0_9GAMM|nr:o-succinylbenzoate synthase [Photobacterium halotolerans]NAW67281.1 o-succinylbenzoate synthase [Photobacterium halotolerans]
MRRSARLWCYQLPMDSGVVLRGRRMAERRGYIAELHEGKRSSLGEIAPLPGFSVESHEQAGQQAERALADWVRGQAFVETGLYPSVAFGLSMAGTELTGILPAAGQFRTAPLLNGETDIGLQPAQRLAKLKVGRAEPWQDAAQVNQYLGIYPNLMLRLDANQAWSLVQARAFCRAITPSHISRITFIEEPCQRPADSLSFADESGMALAWDETLQQAVRQPGFRLESLGRAAAIVIKPTLIGSVQRCANLIRHAQILGMQAVISSSLESSLGLTQLARLSGWLLPDSVPGLDTLNLFQSQLEVPWPGSTLPIQLLHAQTPVWQS